MTILSPMKLKFYLESFGNQLLPNRFRQYQFDRKLRPLTEDEQIRLDYYCKKHTPFALPNHATTNRNFKYQSPSAYYFDLKKHLNYFSSNLKFCYRFGDDTHLEDHPFFVKARPIHGDNQNAILMKLNQLRHFHFVSDNLSFREKKSQLVWRGAAYQPHRREFIQRFYNHPLCNLGQTNKPAEDVPWQTPKMSIPEQLQYQFLLAIEGNDVASSLQWNLSSNSLCMMTKPKFETWFMEGTLIPNYHYVQLKDDYSDLEEKIEYYRDHPDEAEFIIENAHAFVKPFQDKQAEETLSLHVLKRYFQLSGQMPL